MPSGGVPENASLAEPPAVAAAKTAVLEERYADAVVLLEGFLAAHPDHVQAWHRLAGARTGLDQNEAALAAADRAVALDPDCAPAHLMRALALSFLFRWGEVQRAASRSIELDSGKADPHALLAEALSQQGRADAALDAARAALAIDPQQRAALRILAYTGSPFARWSALGIAVALPVTVALGVRIPGMTGSARAVVTGFALVALLGAFVGVLRKAVDREAPVVFPPRAGFLVAPAAATAWAVAPLLLTGADRSATLSVVLFTAVPAALFTAGLYQAQQRRISHAESA